jgi:hypothetical protein
MDSALCQVAKSRLDLRGFPSLNVAIVSVGLLLGYWAPTLLQYFQTTVVKPLHAALISIRSSISGHQPKRDAAACMEDLQTTVEKLRY